MVHQYEYYVSGHYPSSCFYLKRRTVYISKPNISETGFCFRLQVKPTHLGPNINRTMDNVQKHKIYTGDNSE
jgi:hypothetical protein